MLTTSTLTRSKAFRALRPVSRPQKTTLPKQSLKARLITTEKSPKPVFREDEIVIEGRGFLQRVMSSIRDVFYYSKQGALARRIHEMEPTVRALMDRKDIESFTRQERDVIAQWISLNQDYHTYKRRKFFIESSERIQDSTAPKKSRWDLKRDRLVMFAEESAAERHPGGDRVNLWSQEALFMQADAYSHQTQRFARKEASLNTFNLAAPAARIHHLEPALPPSYQARAAAALQNEGKAFDREANDRLQQLILRREMETPLDETLARLNRVERPSILPSRIRNLFQRSYTTSSSNTPLPNTSNKIGEQPDTLISTIRNWFAKNGPLGVTLYLAYSTIDLTLVYLIISMGVDVSSLLAMVGIQKGAGAATFAVAYAIHKILAPARATAVVFTIPYVRPHWDKLIAKAEAILVSRENDKLSKEAEKKSDSKPTDK